MDFRLKSRESQGSFFSGVGSLLPLFFQGSFLLPGEAWLPSRLPALSRDFLQKEEKMRFESRPHKTWEFPSRKGSFPSPGANHILLEVILFSLMEGTSSRLKSALNSARE